MNFRFFLILTLLMTYAISPYAQSRFVKGYIITNNKDTLHGFIQDRSEFLNSMLVKFRPSLESKTERYSPDSLTAYYISNGNAYFSREITEQIHLYKFKKVFLKRLTEGRIELYHYLSGGRRRVFLEKDSGGLRELINLPIEKSFNKSILVSLLTDCQGFHISKIKFRMKTISLIKLINTYNQCLQPELYTPLVKIDEDTLLKETKIVQSPQIYFKPFLRYNQPHSLTNAPEYFSLSVPSYSTSSFGGSSSILVASDIKKFSVAKGISYGGILGYKFNEYIGIEMGFEYFNFNKTIESPTQYRYGLTGTTDWNLKSFNCLPAFTFSETLNRSVLTGKIGAVIGISTLDNSIYINYPSSKDLKSYTFNKSLSLGYMLGIEYSYFFKPNISFSIESGIENYSYTPKSAKLTKYLEHGRDKTQNSTERIKNIEYRNQIRNITDKGTSSQDRPEIRIKETLAIRKIYLGIGIKFIINKNEKN